MINKESLYKAMPVYQKCNIDILQVNVILQTIRLKNRYDAQHDRNDCALFLHVVISL